MAKQLNFTFNDKEYTLEFTRRTVAEMERNGFIVTKMDEKPMNMLPALFEGAFLAHHRATPKKTIDEIFDHMPDKQTLVSKLAEMYSEPIASLLDEPEDVKGNVVWTANW